MAEISVVILAKNEEKYIGSTLDMVFRQGIDKEYEVIVIDSGSKDDTLKIVKRYPVKLVEIPTQEFGHGRTRNLGVRMAGGKITVFLNADATPVNEDWLESLIAAFQNDEKIAGVYSCAYPRHNCNPVDARNILGDNYLFDKNKKIKYIPSPSAYEQMNKEEKRKLVSFHTVSCAIDRSILLENPFADIRFGEDLEWSKRMLEKGFKILYEPNSEVIHSHNIHSSVIKTIKRYFDDARLNQRLFKKWAVIDLLKFLLVVIVESRKDAAYILKMKRNFIIRARWILHSFLTRMAEFVGILLGAIPFLPEKFVDRLSLAEELRRD